MSGGPAIPLWLMALGLWLLLPGCATKRAGYDILATRPADGTVTPGDIYPLLSGEWTWLVTSGDDAGEHVVRRRGETETYSAAWSDDEDDRRSEYWGTDEVGNIVMPAVAEYGDRAITFFDPPLVIAYADLPASVEQRQEVTMRVMDARRRGRLKDQGTAVRTVEYVEDHRLRTALGEFETRRIMITFTADLRMAKAETNTTLYVAPELGPIVEERRETVKTMGIPIRSRNQTLVLVQAPGVMREAPSE